MMKSENKNRLGLEKSPYLLQHKDNPVWWYAWGEDAFQSAKKENKPIFLSIGYSTCHWCHVMEHESFEDPHVADLLNQNFISIKVDREERPDVDKIYMDAIVATTGHGGWPMSVFLDHDLKPFYGGTYFPMENFMRMLKAISEAWKKDFKKIHETGQQITEYLNTQVSKGAGAMQLTDQILSLALKEAHQSFDTVYGGFGHAPKFPPSTKVQVLLRIARRDKDKEKRTEALAMVEKTLDSMARGGMYDHLGGGFHRYSTDEAWLVPHFEKMLYDQASLVLSYLEAYQLTHRKMYRDIAQETLDYVLRDMGSNDGGFYSAEDADSEGEEGKFYVWTQAELKKHLSNEEFEKFKKVYGVTTSGNFEHASNILNLQKEYDWPVKSDPLVVQATHILFSIREMRIRPRQDDKVLTDWNGLMIAAMAKGYQVLGELKYLVAAQKAASFLRQTLYKNHKLLKRYRDNDAQFSGTLDDYAYVIFGLLSLYESDFNPQWMEWADELQQIQNTLFWDERNSGYFFTEKNAPHLIRRSKDYQDEARPNSNAIAALNLLKLYAFLLKPEYAAFAQHIFSATSDLVQKHPGAYGALLLAMDYYLDQSKEIVLVGNPKDEELKKILTYLYQEFLPNRVIAFCDEKNLEKIPLTQNKRMIHKKGTVYICERQTCKLPVYDLEGVKKVMRQ